MTRHIILWTLKEMPEAEKARVKAEIKAGLEGLAGQIPSSNADLMLDSSFESPAALAAYATHPAHVAVADGKVRPYTAVRSCLDFEE